MVHKLEILPNEILISILSYFSWDEILTYFWSLNKRFNSLICSITSLKNNGIIISKPGLSYRKVSSKLFPLIYKSSSLRSSVRHIHLDGTNSNCYSLIYQCSHKSRNIIHYPNLKSLVLNRFCLSKLLIEYLSTLIQYQLEKLVLTVDEDVLQYEPSLISFPNKGRERMLTFKKFLCQLFSPECQLISLQLSIATDHEFIDIHQCLSSCSSPISNKVQYGCVTLRYLHISIIYTYFLEHLIELVPNLERLSVYLCSSWGRCDSFKDVLNRERIFESNSTWSNKVEKLKYFIVKSVVHEDFQLHYLKWIFNNLNHVEKIKLRFKIAKSIGENPVIDESPVDASFVRRYLMGDITINLTHFDFHIISYCKSSSNNIERIIDSFKFEPFFIDHQWTNVKCLFDPVMSYQHLSSFISNKSPFFNDLISYSDIFVWPDVRYFKIRLFPNLVRFLEQFRRFLPNVSTIEFDLDNCRISDETNYSKVLQTSFEIGQSKLNNIYFQNVTRLTFGSCFHRNSGRYEELTDQSKRRAIILAYLISMPVQLIYLRIEQFQWLLHIVECASNELRKDVLSTVRYAEFCLTSCNHFVFGSSYVCRSLVPFLSSYMPYLQTLCLWKPDDLPWTYIEPNFKQKHDAIFTGECRKFLKTSISESVNVFKEDLCQLTEQLKQLVFLNIYGNFDREKVRPYRFMVEKYFPNSHIYLERSRFRLWM